MVAGFNGKAGFISENYGESALAKRYGVKRYPAIFVDDVLVATPNDFGFYGKGEGGETTSGGRYAPIKNAASQERFRADLTRMVGLILSGQKDAARAQAAPAKAGEVAAFPAVRLTDLDGKTLTQKDLAGRVVLVEFWATWCPPCRGAMSWLGELKKRYGDRVAVVAIAIESEEAGIRQWARELKVPFTWVKSTPEIGRAFGDVSAVPTLLVFDRQGRTAAVYFGAPPTLHQEAETKLASILK
ncbi:MAG TPA: TlpA disulfide reductase family protein [Thermoanaerobaculia bacterium]